MPSESYPSIFAHDLATVLQSHSHTLADLRRKPFSLEGKKVDRLERSLFPEPDGPAELPALNHGELMTVVLMLKLSEEERLRLYAAIIALGTQRLLLDYLSAQRVWEIACEVRDAAVEWLRDHRSGDDLFPRRRSLRQHGPAPEEPEATEENILFTEALDAFDEGAALSALGQFRTDNGSRALLERAQLCLERAEALMQLLPDSVQATEDWNLWYALVVEELHLVHEELD